MGIDRKPLMPTTPWRAEKWIKSGKATPFWSHGVFCVRLNVESGKKVQVIAVGIDPGSKREGFTIKSEKYTFLNIQADAVTWVKDSVKGRGELRRNRRVRNTPYRPLRRNRSRGSLVPSTKARWQWKLRIASWLCRLFPVDCFVVEDIRAETLGKRRWDKAFSPLQHGKNWFYTELKKLSKVELLQGYETSALRKYLGLVKTTKKLEDVFSAHCVDSFVLASWYTGWASIPDNKKLLIVSPLRFYRRQLHVMQPIKGNIRKNYGGTRSLGFKRGSIVTHPKYGATYVGGTSQNNISLHSLKTGERLSQKIKPKDCKFLGYTSWREHFSSNI
jgi:hypothetical protein